MASRLLTATLLAALAGSLAACVEKPDHLTGTWLLVEASDAEGEMSLLDSHPVTLTVAEDGTFTGVAACNHYGGEATTSSGVWLPGEVSRTEMACEGDGVMELESQYLEALLDATRYEASPEHLTLDGPDVTLRFARQTTSG